ncbi:MAG: DUF5606 domain-containing protein [Alphaproteobacteria bacterium]|nr:DUF5606 domain-containing protein [Alphaproteobacteria bacterium]
MEFKKLINITGKPGLYELLNSKQDGVIVKKLGTQDLVFVSNRKTPFALLSNIEMFTTTKNILLKELLKIMKDSAEPIPEPTDLAGTVAYFKKIYPELDFNRIYPNDFKRLIQWFQLIKEFNIAIEE